jgi:hypothetical protein
MTTRTIINRLNDLDPKAWLKFQKSWFVHNPPPRRKDVLRHPAKFPETLSQEFIEFFTKRGGVVLDPMAGTGSALVAALRSGRHSYGIELNPAYAICQPGGWRRRVVWVTGKRAGGGSRQGNTADVACIVADHNIGCRPCSPTLLGHAPRCGAGHSINNASKPGRILFDDPADLGNLTDYNEFIEAGCYLY